MGVGIKHYTIKFLTMILTIDTEKVLTVEEVREILSDFNDIKIEQGENKTIKITKDCGLGKKTSLNLYRPNFSDLISAIDSIGYNRASEVHD